MSVIREWLPAGHLTSDAVRGAISGALAAWSDAWFGRAVVRLSLVRLADEAAIRTGWSRHAGWSLYFPRGGKRRLALLALDAGPGQEPVSEVDTELVEAFEATLFNALGNCLDAVFGAADGPSNGPEPGDLLASLWLDDAEIGQVAVPRQAVVQSVRRGASARRVAAAPLTGRRQAMGLSTVRLEARLGSATLSLDEARNLAVGDVLVLDTRLDDPLVLNLTPTGPGVAWGRLTPLENQMALTLEGRPNG